MIKSTQTKNQNNNTTFNIDSVKIIENYGFNTIIPENYDVKQLFYLINSAKYVIMTWGCCSYLNSVFINNLANVLILCNIGYKKEYTDVLSNYNISIFETCWFPKTCNKKLIMYDVEHNFSEENKIILQQNIYELIK